jgi:hypothetical protein
LLRFGLVSPTTQSICTTAMLTFGFPCIATTPISDDRAAAIFDK